MTLVDTAERLETLVRDASAAADAGSLEAALREVHGELGRIRDTSNFGILEAEWWSQLPATDQHAVRVAAKRAADVVRPLIGETDEVLAAYGRGGGQQDRGAFSGLLRAFRSFATAIARAQASLIRGWRESLWPLEQGAELDVHALMPETADTAREVLSAVDALSRAVEADRPLAADAIADLHTRCQVARAAADKLGDVSVPEPVLTLFAAVQNEATVRLNAISPEVFAWLVEHGATRLFVVGRSA